MVLGNLSYSAGWLTSQLHSLLWVPFTCNSLHPRLNPAKCSLDTNWRPQHGRRWKGRDEGSNADLQRSTWTQQPDPTWPVTPLVRIPASKTAISFHRSLHQSTFTSHNPMKLKTKKKTKTRQRTTPALKWSGNREVEIVFSAALPPAHLLNWFFYFC